LLCDTHLIASKNRLVNDCRTFSVACRLGR
jgi:hypothetical protein